MARDYQRQWVSPEGEQYREDFFQRSKFDGTEPLNDNPTTQELIKSIEIYNPKSILEVGCGFGRLIVPLILHFKDKGVEITGCDVSKDMLNRCPDGLDVFLWDVCEVGPAISDMWDVGFCRGVFMYFRTDQMMIAMRNICLSIGKKFIVYEWDWVCKKMQEANSSDLFEYHVILAKPE